MLFATLMQPALGTLFSKSRTDGTTNASQNCQTRGGNQSNLRVGLPHQILQSLALRQSLASLECLHPTILVVHRPIHNIGKHLACRLGGPAQFHVVDATMPGGVRADLVLAHNDLTRLLKGSTPTNLQHLKHQPNLAPLPRSSTIYKLSLGCVLVEGDRPDLIRRVEGLTGPSHRLSRTVLGAPAGL